MKHIEIIKSINQLDCKYIIAGISGGPDSMALLHMLINNTNKKIICAHINHNIRKESETEEKYLQEYCKNNNIIFETIKIKKYTENNLENEARKKRYTFFEEILQKYNSKYLVLAHHGDDLIETILMKIIRGSNIEGYAGIKTYSKHKNYIIIRPLLTLTKEDLIKYNYENKIKYFVDNSNTDKKYTRNRIRKNILPELKNEDKNIHLKFLKYSNTLQEYNDYIEDLTNEKLKDIYINNTIYIDKIKKEHNLIQKNIIYYILKDIYNNEEDIIKFKNIEDILKLINNKKPNIELDLPKNYKAVKEYNKMYIKKGTKSNENFIIEFKECVKIDNFVIKKIETSDTDGNDICRLNSNNIALPLYIRNKKDGDKISLLGTDGTKKIKEIFIENKIPINKRNNYPILVDKNDNILWIPNIKKSKYNVKKNEIYDIILTCYEEREEQCEKENK